MRGLSAAANTIRPDAVELYPTYSAIGIEAACTDDNKASANGSFIWRKAGEKAWRNGVEMTLDRKRKLIWASIWPLEPGETVEVKITFGDAKSAIWEGRATTRQFNFTPDGGRIFFVSPTGDDANAGTKEKPFRTLAHAATQLKPGDTVQARSGIYAEGDLFQGLKGNAQQPIIITAAPDEKPILDSSLVIARTSGVWKKVGNGVFVAKAKLNTDPTGYVAQDGRRMFPYPSLTDLKSDKAKARRAWFYDAETKNLYVRTGSGSEPDAHTYNLSQHAYGIHLTKGAHVVVRGFTIRHYGAVAIRLSEGATGCVIHGNRIHNCAGGIFMKNEITRDNAIWHNEIYEVGASDFAWEAHYSIEYPNQAIYCDKAGRGNSFCHNTIHGYFDLISVESWKNPENLQYNRDCDIMFNTLYNSSDDAIEVDGGGVNMRIESNHIRNCRTAISLAPVERGPVYVTRNHATFFGLFIKFNVGDTASHGWTYIYHNSGYCLVRGDDSGVGISFAPNLPCTNKILKNNIVMVNEWCVRAWRPDNVLDYNCYYHIPNRAPRRFQANTKTYNTLAEFARAVGQETHGLYADPSFVSSEDAGKYAAPAVGAALADIVVLKDPMTGDLRLRPGSPCIDGGVLIRGFNENFRGKAPDIGAFESGK